MKRQERAEPLEEETSEPSKQGELGTSARFRKHRLAPPLQPGEEHSYPGKGSGPISEKDEFASLSGKILRSRLRPVRAKTCRFTLRVLLPLPVVSVKIRNETLPPLLIENWERPDSC
ncbi:hypothetical protein NXF25_013025 [Crotalus adamanteus]|uniref:Uncharacterized protein n=1 Tax=Crotalus adamanteus TaxID=8729 RepID=A0AAW1BCP1_CROAD